jgi:hypothetical protein
MDLIEQLLLVLCFEIVSVEVAWQYTICIVKAIK